MWGIVTNKPEYLARLILPQHGWQQRCAVLVGGDSLAERKPHPLPLLHAAQAIGVAAEDCVYVGDDERDIIAARAAAMPSVAALWGYRLHSDDPLAWQADVLVENAELLQLASLWPTGRQPRPSRKEWCSEQYRAGQFPRQVAQPLAGMVGGRPFVAESQRELAVAWFALLQEFDDMLNTSGDPLPADAKLAWWARSCAAGRDIARAIRWAAAGAGAYRGPSWPKHFRIWLKRARSRWMRRRRARAGELRAEAVAAVEAALFADKPRTGAGRAVQLQTWRSACRTLAWRVCRAACWTRTPAMPHSAGRSIC